MSKLILTTEGDTVVIVKRRIAAAPKLVYRAHTEAEMLQQWNPCPEGWTMRVSVNEARPGGLIRREWSNGKGGDFRLTGEYLVLVPFSRIISVQRMHLPDTKPDIRVETTFTPDGAGTFMKMRMTLFSLAERAALLSAGFELGMEAGYFKLESMIAGRSPRISAPWIIETSTVTGNPPGISTPQIVETSMQEAAVIHLAIPAGEMMKRFGLAA